MRKPTLATIFLVVFVDLIGFGIVLPLIQFAGRDLGASGLGVGVIIASYSLMQFLFAPVWGRLSDRYGRRPIILISLLGSTLSYGIFAMAQSWQILLVSRIFGGICGANISVAQAYISDITPPEQRSKGMGLIGMSFGLGFILGPVIGGLAVGERHAYWLAGGIASALCGVNLLMALFYLPESRKPGAPSERKTFLSPWKVFIGAGYSPVLIRLFWVTFCTNLAFTIWETTFGMWIKETPPFLYHGKQYGYILAYVGLISAAIQGGIIGKLSQRFGEIRLLQFSSIIMLGASLTLPVSLALPLLLGVLALLALGNGVNRPALYGMISLISSTAEQGAILGVVQSMSSLARIIGPPLGGRLFDWNPNAPYWMGSLALMVSAVLLFGLKQRNSSVAQQYSGTF